MINLTFSPRALTFLPEKFLIFDAYAKKCKHTNKSISYTCVISTTFHEGHDKSI